MLRAFFLRFSRRMGVAAVYSSKLAPRHELEIPPARRWFTYAALAKSRTMFNTPTVATSAGALRRDLEQLLSRANARITDGNLSYGGASESRPRVRPQTCS